MSIILEHRISKKRCVLLGTAFGVNKSAHTDPWYGGIKAILGSSRNRLLAVADDAGKIEWVDPEDYSVASVSGSSPKEAIQASFDNTSPN